MLDLSLATGQFSVKPYWEKPQREKYGSGESVGDYVRGYRELLEDSVKLRLMSDVQRGVLIAALGASLVGDVVLMTPDARFEAGLAAFLLAHVLYVIAMIPDFTVGPALAAGCLIVAIGFGVVPRLLSHVRPHGPLLLGAVSLYIVLVTLTGVVAAGTAVLVTAIGGGLFVASDALLGWGRFVGPAPGGRVLVHITYHLGQIGLVLWLAS